MATELVTSNYQKETHSILSYDRTRLHVHCWRPVEKPVNRVALIVHGMGGHADYYAASLAPYLVPEGTVIYGPDLRGHGLSDGKRGDIESFAELERDVEAAIQFARERHPGLPLFLLGESMGTPLAILHAATSQGNLRPDFLALLACVVAPTIQPRLDEILRTTFYLAVNRRKVALPITGREEKGVRDPEFVQILKSDSLFNRRISVRFLMSMTGAMSRAARLAERLNMPTLIMMGGKDITVRRGPTMDFYKRIPASDKEMHVFPEAFHAILNDPDSHLVRARLLEWMERQTQIFMTGVES